MEHSWSEGLEMTWWCPLTDHKSPVFVDSSLWILCYTYIATRMFHICIVDGQTKIQTPLFKKHFEEDYKDQMTIT